MEVALLVAWLVLVWLWKFSVVVWHGFVVGVVMVRLCCWLWYDH